MSVKLYIFNFFLLFSISISAQKYYTKTGITEFDGSKAAFEPIKAINNSSISAIDVANGNIAALIKIKDFDFRLGLMQEHFNENYLESYKYPKSTFDGNIEILRDSIFDENNEIFNPGLVNDNPLDIIIKGSLTIKGVTNEIIATGKIKKIENDLNLISSFSIKLSDFNIKIPKVVFMKIDEIVKINLNYNYELQN
mgnify:CR=1 FL=1|tara:strand:+ start:2682 stop:3269 length:588 start_codon:yes stop_codon:yes gene_type:complete